MGLLIVGNPENRRVRDFQATAKAMGHACPICISWRDLIDDWQAITALSGKCDVVRLDSPGENDDVLRRLICLGGGHGHLMFGELGFLSEQYIGFCKVLDRLSTLNVAFQIPPADVKVMFDKWASHKRFASAGLLRPRTALPPLSSAEFPDFRSSFCTRASGRLFLKPRYASSASGVCAYRWSNSREQLLAPIELKRSGDSVHLFNSLRVRKYTSPQDVGIILEYLLPQGMICEEWIPKIRLPDGQLDLRVLVINGEARHIVVRQSRSPMTNLHLGNRRGDLDEVRTLVGARIVDACNELAENAAACFPDSLYAGIDVLIPARGEPIVCEINAFGDLLPNLKHRNESPYEAILRASNVCCHPV